MRHRFVLSSYVLLQRLRYGKLVTKLETRMKPNNPFLIPGYAARIPFAAESKMPEPFSMGLTMDAM